MLLIAIVLGAIAVIGTLIPLLRNDAWWIRIFDFPRIHLLVLALISALLFFLAMRNDWTALHIVALILLGAAAVYQAIQIFPYTPLARHQVAPADGDTGEATLSLMVANVLMTNRETGRLLELIREYNPDVLLTVETDAYWAEALTAIEEEYPNFVSQPLENTYGMILHSRLPLEGAAVRYLVEDDIPSIHAHVTLSDGTRVRLYFLHPRPPYPKEDDDTTERDAELLVVGRKVESRDEIAVVAGDLNDVAWSHTTHLFQRISQMLDPRVGRGMYNSFHAGIPLLRWPLDHVFFTKHFKLVRLERLPNFGSDHFPIFVEIARDPSAPVEQETPSADEEDHDEAAEKIERARLED